MSLRGADARALGVTLIVVVAATLGVAAAAGTTAATGAAGTGGGGDVDPATVGPPSDIAVGADTVARATTVTVGGPATTEAGDVSTAATSVTRCRVIETSGVYELGADLVNRSGGDCLVVNASDVTIDGNGATIAGGGTGVGVDGVGAGNLTVRDLTVRNFSIGVNGRDATGLAVRTVDVREVRVGIDAGNTAAPVVRGVDVETVGGTATTTGINVAESDGLRLRSVTVETRSSGQSSTGVGAFSAANARVGDITVTSASRNVTLGLSVIGASNVTVEGYTADNYSYGAYAPVTDGFTLRSATVRNATVGLQLDDFGGGADATVDRATIEDVTLGRVSGRIEFSGTTQQAQYALVDDSNDVTVRNLSTPNATLRSFAGANVSLAPVGATPAPPRDIPIGRVALAARGTTPSATVAFGYDDPRLDESTVDAFVAGAGGSTWNPPVGTVNRDPVNDTVTLQTTQTGTYGAFGNDSALSTCTRIESAGTYTLEANLTPSLALDEACIEVNASDVTVDGTGHAIVANSSGIGVGVADASVSNLTVRNLTLQDLTAGVDAEDTDSPAARTLTIRKVRTGLGFEQTTGPVVRNVVLEGPRTGVDVARADDAEIRALTARQVGFVAGVDADRSTRTTLSDVDVRINTDSTGVSLEGTSSPNLSNVTVEQTGSPAGVGVGAPDTINLTARGLVADGVGVGIEAPGGDVAVRNVTVRSSAVAVTFAGFPSRFSSVQSAPVETGTVRNVTVLDPVDSALSQGRTIPAAHVRVDGSNDVQVVNLTTPNATFRSFAGSNVTLAPVRVSATPPRPVTVGRANVTTLGSDPSATVGFGYDVRRLDESTVAAYQLGFGGWSSTSGSLDRANDTLTVQTAGDRTVGAFADRPSVSGCRRIETAGVYGLTGDLSPSLQPGETCIAVNASDVVIDGNGRALAGNGSGTAVGVVRSGLSNVTVRNLTARNVSTGVALDATANATVADVATGAVTTGVDLGFSTGPTVRGVRAVDRFSTLVAVGDATDPAVRNVTATAPVPTGITAVSVADATRPTVEDVTVDAGLIRGLVASGATDAVVRDVSVRGADVGVRVADAPNLSVRSVSVAAGTTGLAFGPSPDGLYQNSGTPESGTVSNVTLRSLDTYVSDDGAGDATVHNLSTPTGEVASLSVRNASVTAPGATPPRPAPVAIGRFGVSNRSVDARVDADLRYDPSQFQASSLALYELDGGGWSRAAFANGSSGATRDGATETFRVDLAGRDATGTYGAFAAQRTITGCTRIDAPGVYRFAGNVTGSAAVGAGCIEIDASDVTIDGNGATFAGNGSGNGIEVARTGLSNLTVRNLTVRNWSNGVTLGRSTNATIANLTFVDVTSGAGAFLATRPTIRDVRAAGSYTTLVATKDAIDPVVRNVTTASTASGSNGVFAADAVRPTIEDVTINAPDDFGVNVQRGEDAVVRNVTVRGGSGVGVRLPDAVNHSVRNVTVVGARTGVTFARARFSTPDTPESGTVRNVTLRDLDTYVVNDGAGVAVLEGVSTPTATGLDVRVRNASVSPAGATPPRPTTFGLGRVSLAGRGDDALVAVDVPYDPTRVDESSVTVYEVDGGVWTPATLANASSRTGRDEPNRTAEADLRGADATGTYGVFATGQSIDACTRIDQPGTYTLAGNLTATGPGPCVAVNASDVTIDGAGHTITGNVSATGVATVRDGLSNVTVRDLSVVGLSSGEGIDLAGSVDATIRSVTVEDARNPLFVPDATGLTATDLDLRGAASLFAGGLTDARLADVSLVTDGAKGIALTGADNVTLANVTVAEDRGLIEGIRLVASRNVTVRNATVRSVDRAIQADGATDATIVDVTAVGTRQGIQFVPRQVPRTISTETATVSNVTVRDPVGTSPGYVAVDDTNDVTVTDLRTPNATVVAFTGANASLSAVGATPPAPTPTPVTVGRVNVSSLGPDTRASVAVSYADAPVNETSVAVYRVDEAAGEWSRRTANASVDRSRETAGVTNVGAGTYGVFGQQQTIAGCTRIDESGVYRVAGDITTTAGTCIAVNASDVTIDGGGHAIVGDGAGTGVVSIPFDPPNLTVRNLTVRNMSTAVDLSGTDPTVRNLTATEVVTGVVLENTIAPVLADTSVTTVAPEQGNAGLGVGVGDSVGLRADNVTVDTRATGKLPIGFYALNAVDANVSGLTLRADARNATAPAGSPATRNATFGLVAGGSQNLTVRDAAVDGYAFGVTAAETDGVRVENLTVDNATVAALTAPLTDSAVTEETTLRNVTVGPVEGSTTIETLDGPTLVNATYLRVDGSNDVRVRNLTTPTASLATFAGENVSLVPIADAPAAPRNATIGRVNLTRYGANATATARLRYEETAIDESTAAAYRVTGGAWTRLAGNASVDTTNDTALLSGVAPGTYGAFAAAATDDGPGEPGLTGDVSTCGRIDRSGVYELTGNLTAAGDDCLVVNASDVVVDGNGFAVDAGGSAGLVAERFRLSNLTVRNLTVRNASQGVDVSETLSTTVRNVRVRDAGTGVESTIVSNATVRAVRARNVTTGVAVGLATETTVRNVRVRDSNTGVQGANSQTTTVRNVTARNVSKAVEFERSDNATIRGVRATDAGFGVLANSASGLTAVDVRVETDASGRFAGSPGVLVGAVAGQVTDVTVRDVRVTAAGTRPDSGLVAVNVSDLHVRNVSIGAATRTGILVTDSRDVRARNLTVNASGADRALALDGSTGLSVADVDVRAAGAGIDFRRDGRTPTVENGTVRDVQLVAPDGPYLRTDGSNDVTFRRLRTPNATLAAVTVRNGSLSPLGTTPPAPGNASVTAGRVNVTATGASPSATVSVAYDAGAVDESTVGAYRVDGAAGSWTRLSAGPNATATVDRRNDTVTIDGVRPDTYGAFAAPNGSDGDGDGNESLPLGARLFPDGIPGGTANLPPTDTDGDDLLEDVDGDGQFTFVDVIEFVFALQRGDYSTDALSSAQIDALDHDPDGRVTFTDLIDLVFEVSR
jgi:hypothetical protein